MTTSNYNASTDFLQKLANSAMLQVDNTRSMIWNLIEPTNDFAYLREPDFTYSVSKPSLGTPPKLSDVLDLGDTTDTRLEKLNADAAAWMDKFFPSMDKCLRELPEDWLCGVISGVKPFGQDATVFELVWHRARDRAYRTMATEQRQLEAAFTGRGFTLPPGAMVAALGEAAGRADTAILDVNREQAIKDAEIKLEILKFAEQQALTYKLGILQALADFYRQWIALPDQDLEPRPAQGAGPVVAVFGAVLLLQRRGGVRGAGAQGQAGGRADGSGGRSQPDHQPQEQRCLGQGGGAGQRRPRLRRCRVPGGGLGRHPHRGNREPVAWPRSSTGRPVAPRRSCANRPAGWARSWCAGAAA